MDHHEAAAADIAGARIGHGQRKAGRDRRIDRIAALPQEVGADLGRDLLLRHHHAVFGGNAREPWRDRAAYRAGALLRSAAGAARATNKRDGRQRAAPSG